MASGELMSTRLDGMLAKIPGLSQQKLEMLSRMFGRHGDLCASRPWEVIIGTLTLTVCLVSMSLFSSTDKICNWNYKCGPAEEILSSDVIVLSIIKCLAVIYVYLQFRNLRKLGSKYLLGIAGVLTIFASFVSSVATVHLAGIDLTGLNEALPFFLLLVDLSKASALTKFALSSRSQDEVRENIARGMAVLGPMLTLDAIVETLVIGVGTLSGVEKLETMCLFGCLSVIANYVAFMTFFPACLTLVVEYTQNGNQGRPVWQINQLGKMLEEEEEETKPNPVTQRVKIIMSAGLMLIHIHSRWVTAMTEDVSKLELQEGDLTRHLTPTTPLWQFYVTKMLPPTIDYSITLFLAAILAAKYIFFDSEVDFDSHLETKGNETLPHAPNTLPQAPNTLPQAPNTRPQAPNTLPQALNTLPHAPNTLPHAPIQPSIVVSPPQEESTTQTDVQMDVTPQLSATANPVHEKADGEIMPRATFSIGDENDENENEGMVEKVSMETQTDSQEYTESDSGEEDSELPIRSLSECVRIMKFEGGASVLSDAEVLLLLESRNLKGFQLESALGDHKRAVSIRRKMVAPKLQRDNALENLPHKSYDYKNVHGACCENVVGYMPIPVGVAGPLLLDGTKYMVPMATTEGTLIASTNRGCNALTAAGGVTTMLNRNGMTRAPVVRFPSAKRASTAKLWLEERDNFELLADAFKCTSRFARLQKLQVSQAARCLYIRFVATTGDAMGMNMLSKGSEKALGLMQTDFFQDMDILSLSGNFCTDKKPSAVNWLEGRGKSVVCEATIPANIVRTTLKTSASALSDLFISKNLVGSCMAGSLGGFNAHAANIVTAIYIATGQDPAQVVCSSYCLTVMEPAGVDGEDLYISCTMPSLEVGTVGGGTVLPPQAACLEMLGVRGACTENPGANAAQLARIICATVLAGELSLMSALAAGHLVRSHMKHNRSSLNMGPTDVAAK